MSDFVRSAEWTDPEAESALAKHYGTLGICRSIVDGQKGYTVIGSNGVQCFYWRLGDALRAISRGLGHGEDRDVMVVGEPEMGNCWAVRRTETP